MAKARRVSATTERKIPAFAALAAAAEDVLANLDAIAKLTDRKTAEGLAQALKQAVASADRVDSLYAPGTLLGDLWILTSTRWSRQEKGAAVERLVKTHFRRPVAPKRWKANNRRLLEALDNKDRTGDLQRRTMTAIFEATRPERIHPLPHGKRLTHVRNAVCNSVTADLLGDEKYHDPRWHRSPAGLKSDIVDSKGEEPDPDLLRLLGLLEDLDDVPDLTPTERSVLCGTMALARVDQLPEEFGSREHVRSLVTAGVHISHEGLRKLWPRLVLKIQSRERTAS